MIDGGVFSLEAVRLLLEQGDDPNVRDNTGRTIILYAACCRANYPDMSLLDELLERDDISREDKIYALEMAGAVLLCNDGKTEEDVTLAFKYWRRALTLRLMDTEESRPIYKTPTRSMNGALSEWSTEEDLMQMNSSQHELQSLLVQLRIFCSLGWRAVCEHVFPSIKIFLVRGLDGQRLISQGLDLCWAICSTILSSDRPYESDLHSTLLDFANFLMAVLNRLSKDDPNFNSNNFQKIVEIVFMADPSYFTESTEADVDKNRHLTNLFCMVNLLSRSPEMMTEEIRLPLVQHFHRDSRDSSGRQILFNVCSMLDPNTSSAFRFLDTLSAIRFLVNLGADLNARDQNGLGLLHILAVMPNGETRDATARLLLKLGAHLDLADNYGKTAVYLWLLYNNQEWQHLPDWLKEGVPKLKCLCSRVVRRHRIPYEEINILPVVLVPFVSLH